MKRWWAVTWISAELGPPGKRPCGVRVAGTTATLDVPVTLHEWKGERSGCGKHYVESYWSRMRATYYIVIMCPARCRARPAKFTDSSCVANLPGLDSEADVQFY